ncbi:glucosaminidase domain-containing protein [Photobacterium rosenbergii]|uniref:Glucosaminidase domain-containing protein n=1 Tax=Photobacterium rosenbergii TaxID=294936 RepID=A0ABU3ZF87_9GAMM|nr:glucosaminidase domain-containing protein [Photobacterium rosenbergii]MDV5168772.1 glucosaminidase domain-containing protein [Photobacterium rosenbergii]
MIKNITSSKVAIIALVSGLTACGEISSQSSNDEAPAASSQSSKPDFSQITDVNQKKAAFFDFLRPAVEHENQRIEKERQFLENIKSSRSAGKSLSSDQLTYADKLADKYKVVLNDQGVTAEWLTTILNRVDVLPESLVLSQAANESGWGTSRFAVEGNNYFGQWCYRKGCGLVPNARNDGANHEVAVFDSPYLSVQAYFMNVNTNHAYQDLRDIRAAQRMSGEIIEGAKLAEGLSRYSERGQAYVDEIQAMIRHNNQYWRQG